MHTNALRCTEEDYPVLLALAQAIEAITLDGPDVIPAERVAWDYIGYKYVGDAPPENGPDTRTILCDVNGKKYVHVNVRTPFSVGQAAAEAAAGNPEIAAALSTPGRFFVTNPDGSAKDPEFPIRVFL
jgi:hypothetical protein